MLRKPGRVALICWRWIRRFTGSTDELVLTRPGWRVRFARWLVAFVGLFLAYQLYALVAVPWIEPVSRSRAALPAAPAFGTSGGHPELERLFAPDAWERDSPKLLETRGGKLLFKSYEPLRDGRLELKPCTIILDSPGDERQQPIVLRAEHGASVAFAGKFDPARAQFSPIKAARLNGEVTITSPPTEPGADDALRIVTRNVQVAPTQIWTPADVLFRYGPHHGSGRDLSITLAEPERDETGRKRGVRVGDLRMLELVHVDKLVVRVPSQDLLDQRRPPEGATAPDAAPAAMPSEVEVTCQGPFQFDFQRGVATFEQQVALVRPLPDGGADLLRGDELRIHFEMPPLDREGPAAKAARSAASESDPRSVPVLKAQRVEMLGHPARLDAPSLNAAAEGERLVYDLLSRTIELEDERLVRLTYQQHYVEGQRLKYQLAAEPTRLGQLWAEGPGVYRGQFGQDAEQELTAQWRGLLRLAPQDGMHVLSAAEGGEVALSPTDRFLADQFYCWLQEVAEPNPVDPGSGPELVIPDQQLRRLPAVEEPAPSAPRTDQRKYRVRPVRLLAIGNVQADSPRFAGQTDRLEAWFDEPAPTAAIPEVQPATSATPATPATPASGQRQPSSRAAPRAERAPAPDKAQPGTAPNQRRTELSGSLVRLRVLLAKPRPTIREATVTGNVRLAQFATLVAEQPALQVTGDTLRLQVDPWERATVDVTGDGRETLAQVAANGMWMEGASLHVSQRENRMWSVGPGRMKLPGGRPGATQARPGSAPVWIAWQGGMNFDGQQVRFEDAVEVRTLLVNKNGDRLHVESNGDLLLAILDRYVSFEHAGRDRDDVDVAQLKFLGVVTTENNTFDTQGQQRSHDEMMMKDMVLDRSTGRFQGVGPGWLRSTRYSRTDLAGLSGAAASRAEARQGGEQLHYMRVDFQNEAVGNLNTRELEFRYQVRAVYGPIASWGQTLDPDRPGGLGPRGLVMNCHRLNVVDMGRDGQNSLEMNALGNTVVEGVQFVARGDRLSYSQAKALLVLEGQGYNFAKLEYRQMPGQGTSATEARKIFYWVRTGQFEVKDVRSGQYIQYGNGNPPQARLP